MSKNEAPRHAIGPPVPTITRRPPKLMSVRRVRSLAVACAITAASAAGCGADPPPPAPAPPARIAVDDVLVNGRPPGEVPIPLGPFEVTGRMRLVREDGFQRTRLFADPHIELLRSKVPGTPRIEMTPAGSGYADVAEDGTFAITITHRADPGTPVELWLTTMLWRPDQLEVPRLERRLSRRTREELRLAGSLTTAPAGGGPAGGGGGRQ